MRAWIVLLMLGAGVWIGSSMSQPLFDAAARQICTVHADDHGLELVEASGSLAYDRIHWWTELRSSGYDCVFENANRDLIFLDQFDDALKRTWESRGMRLAGWVVAIGPAVAVLAAAGATGLLQRD